MSGRLLMRLISLLTCAVLVAGCGSGALRPPEGQGGSGSGGQAQGGGGSVQGGGQARGGGGGQAQGGQSHQGGKKKYSWGLPAGDSSPSGNEGSFYGVLLDCQGAEATVAQGWSGFNSPRNALTYMAAAHLCHGDDTGGRPYYEHAVSEYGLAGLREDSRACDVYRSVASVLLQAARESFACAGGEAPPYKTGPDGADNPLTFNVDESQTSSESTTTTTTTTDPGATSTSDPGATSTSDAGATTTSQAEGTG